MITDEELDDHMAAITEMNRRMKEELIALYTARAEHATSDHMRRESLKTLEEIRAMGGDEPAPRYAPRLAENRRRWREAEERSRREAEEGSADRESAAG